VIDGESINHMDATAIDVLMEFIEELKTKGIEIYFVNLKTPVREILSRAGIFSLVGEDRVLASKGSAVKRLFELIDHNYCREECPYVHNTHQDPDGGREDGYPRTALKEAGLSDPQRQPPSR